MRGEDDRGRNAAPKHASDQRRKTNDGPWVTGTTFDGESGMSLAEVGSGGSLTTVGAAVVGPGGSGALFATTVGSGSDTLVEGVAVDAQDDGSVVDAEVEVAVARMMIAGGGTTNGASECRGSRARSTVYVVPAASTRSRSAMASADERRSRASASFVRRGIAMSIATDVSMVSFRAPSAA